MNSKKVGLMILVLCLGAGVGTTFCLSKKKPVKKTSSSKETPAQREAREREERKAALARYATGDVEEMSAYLQTVWKDATGPQYETEKTLWLSKNKGKGDTLSVRKEWRRVVADRVLADTKELLVASDRPYVLDKDLDLQRKNAVYLGFQSFIKNWVETAE